MFDWNVLKNCMWIDQCMFCFEFISVYFVDNLYYSDNIDVKKKNPVPRDPFKDKPIDEEKHCLSLFFGTQTP